MKSSRSLGVTKLSKRAIFSQALNEAQAGINVEKNEKLLFEDKEDAFEDEETEEPGTLIADENPLQASKFAQTPTPLVGSGLKRSLGLDTDGNPVVKRRKRSKKIDSLPRGEDFTAEAVSWDGFDSDADSKVLDPLASISTSLTALHAESEDDHGGVWASSDGESTGDHAGDERKARSSAFKAWATSQFNEALGFTPTAQANDHEKFKSTPPAGINSERDSHMKRVEEEPSLAGTMLGHFQPRIPDIDPLPPELDIGNKISDRKSYSISVNRRNDIQEARLKLPIVPEEQRIMEAIHNHSTVVIAGETGSGKTTQVPQFLFEAGYGQKDGPYQGMIGVTQPRRVAAVSMAKRVGDELNGDHAQRVAYQIRFDSSVRSNTAVKFMTDGILIREISHDFILSRYSAIIIDEAHERTANTDILIGLLSRIVDLRKSMDEEDSNIKPLKLVIMSATLRIQDFLGNTLLFRSGSPPLVHVEGRQYPVTIHFARKTQSDYVQQAYQKICRGHKFLPPGGMLVFLTGQDEIINLSRQLKATLGNDEQYVNEEENETSDGELDEGLEEFNVPYSSLPRRTLGVHILPLYSQLPTKDQLRVFERMPDGQRMIVLATNVAETSLTIPDIRYVFDCGRAKEKKFDEDSGVQSFEVGWISKASASQRAGRAGRTGPGHCYRLYSSAIFERDFEEHSEPEILRMPVEGVVLQLKSMELHNVINFPFPTPPDRRGLAKAEKLLTCLGALSNDGRISPLGRRLSIYPLSPRYAKMLELGNQHGCMNFTIMLVAALATPNVFIPESLLDLTVHAETEVHTHEYRLADEARLKRRSDHNHAQHLCSQLSRTSDALKVFKALQMYINAGAKDQFCKDIFLSLKSMSEASDLMTQVTNIVRNNDPLRLTGSSAQHATPSKAQAAALQQFAAAGFLDQIAILASESPSPPYVGRTPRVAIDVPYLPLFPITTGKRTADTDIRDIAVYPHPSSILAQLPVKEMPRYVVYHHLQRGASSTIEGAKKPKTRMHALTAVSEKALASLARGTPLLEYGKPISKIEEGIGANGKTRTCFVTLTLVGEKGSMGWSLPAQKVVQTRDARGEWTVEQVLS